MAQGGSSGASRPPTRGPVELLLEVTIGLFFVTVMSIFVGFMIEVVGGYFWWPEKAHTHARDLVEQDLYYVAQAPRSLLIEDTVGLANEIVDTVAWPFNKFGIGQAKADKFATQQPFQSGAATGLASRLRRSAMGVADVASAWTLTFMYVTQDVLLRMSVAVFAMPAFALACLMGIVDGMVRRDLRRWGGGRESSFVYHHAKRYTHWALTGGFSLYLAWPFGGFDPALMVLVFTVFTAIALSTTVAAFKKYV